MAARLSRLAVACAGCLGRLSNAGRHIPTSLAAHSNQSSEYGGFCGPAQTTKQLQKHRQDYGQWWKDYERHAQNSLTTARMRHASMQHKGEARKTKFNKGERQYDAFTEAHGWPP